MIFFIVILIFIFFRKNFSSSIKNKQNLPAPTFVNKRQTDISKISDSKAVIDVYNIFKTQKSFYSDDKNCFWSPEITDVDEMIPNKLVKIEYGPYLAKRVTEKCPYQISDAYPSEGFFLLATKVNNQWQLITEPEKMCYYLKDVPAAKEFFINILQGYYGVCK